MPKVNLPFDAETERYLLGLMISDDRIATQVLPALTIDDFYVHNEKNRLIFEAILRIKGKNSPIDIVTVTNELTLMNKLDVVSYDYVLEITENALPTTNIDYYINNLKDMSLYRKMIEALNSFLNQYENNQIDDIYSFINDIEAKVKEISQNRRVNGFKKGGDIVKDVVNELINRVGGDSSTLNGIPTGFPKLDNILGGIKKGELIYLAARPAVGKTALALNFAYNAAILTNRPVAIFEYEMSGDELLKRIIASRTSIELSKINNGYLSNQEKLILKEKCNEIAKAPIYINDRSGTPIEELILKCRKLKDELGDLALIVVDYIGIIGDSPNVNKNFNRQNIVGGYSRKLKELALELGVPIICLSQLNRNPEGRDDRKPQLADLRESGNLEADADKVILLYRPDYYSEQGINLKKKKKDDGNVTINDMKKANNDNPNAGEIVELNLAKNRNGRTTTSKLLFFKSYGRFAEPAKETDEAIERFSL